ncbi:major capsid protein, partial [Mycobacterium tuberculosis]|uniref:major capsid protein n=1 Tax=Mycobacterium tuberculosis TaxID=1773 RepID=UPI0019551394
MAEGQWYRYAPSYVSPAYHLLEGFPFTQEPPSGDLQERVLIRPHDYDQCFQSVQLVQWNSHVKFYAPVYPTLPTAL